MTKRKYVKFSDEEVQMIVKMYKKGEPLRYIVEHVNEIFGNDRTYGSIAQRITQLTKSKKMKKRTKSNKKASGLSYVDVKKTDWDKSDMKQAYGRYLKAYQYAGVKDKTKPVEEYLYKPDPQREAISDTMTELKQFLLDKNAQYGNSVFEPIRIFSTAKIDEQIRVRIDDKLNRLLQGNDTMESDEDVIKDLIGYLVLLLVQMRTN